jgi:aryl carrier-like protein
MSDESELRATSDLMLQMLDEIRDIELAKRAETPGSDAFAQLAYDVTERVRTVVSWSELQLRQANEMHGSAPSDGGRPLESIEPRRLDVVLAEWRQAEIRLSQAEPGSPEANDAAADAERLRVEYRSLQERKLEEQRSR